MVLVPGLVFTNFMSNLLSGDVVSGLSTFARAIPIRRSHCPWAPARPWCYAVPSGQYLKTADKPSHSATCAVCLLLWHVWAFVPHTMFREWGPCCAHWEAPWDGQSLVVQHFSGNPFLSSLLAAVAVGVYAECMARIRKCPASSYLVISMFPLVPGLSVYRAMDYSLQGDTQQFLDTFLRTFGIAGCLSLGLAFIVSTALAIVYHYQRRAR